MAKAIIVEIENEERVEQIILNLQEILLILELEAFEK